MRVSAETDSHSAEAGDGRSRTDSIAGFGTEDRAIFRTIESAGTGEIERSSVVVISRPARAGSSAAGAQSIAIRTAAETVISTDATTNSVDHLYP